MKIIFRVFLAFVIMTFGIAAFLILRYEPEGFRRVISSSLQEHLGVEAKLGDLKIHWDWIPGLRINDIVLYAAGTRAPLFKAQSAVLRLDWSSLKRRKWILRSIEAGPFEISLRRREDRTWEGLILGAQKTPGEVKPDESRMGYFRDLTLKKGTVIYFDETRQPPYEAMLSDLIIKTRTHDREDRKIDIMGEASLKGKGGPDLRFRALISPREEWATIQVNYQSGMVLVSGKIMDVLKSTRFEGTVELRRLAYSSVEEEYQRRRLGIEGKINGHWQGEAEGTHPTDVKQSSTGKGVADIRQGHIKNVNIVEEVLRPIVGLVGLQLMRPAGVAAGHSVIFGKEDTAFESLQAEFQLIRGKIQVQELRLKHEDYLVQAKGRFDQAELHMSGNATLVFLENMSDALTEKIPALRTLRNEQGRIIIPFSVQGTFDKYIIQPELAYVNEKLAQAKKAGLYFPHLGEEDEEEEDDDE